MIYPMFVPIHSGGSGEIKPFESTLEIVACGGLFVVLTVAIFGAAYAMADMSDTIFGKVLSWACATTLVISLWCFFAMYL